MTERTIKIGVTHTGTEEKHSNYVKWLKGEENIEVRALSPGPTKLDSIQSFDGIVLSGGIDMHPKYYQSSQLRYPNAPEFFHEQRDAFELDVFNITRKKNIPLLGVCRGMQLINCALGGTMVQDIGEANMIHRFEQNDKAHGINLIPGSLLNEIANQDRGVVNSAHHQAIKTLGNGLTVNCESDDGIIEGLEWKQKENCPFFLGVQWHPERMFKLGLAQSPFSKNIRDVFITAIKKHLNIYNENN